MATATATAIDHRLADCGVSLVGIERGARMKRIVLVCRATFYVAPEIFATARRAREVGLLLWSPRHLCVHRTPKVATRLWRAEFQMTAMQQVLTDERKLPALGGAPR